MSLAKTSLNSFTGTNLRNKFIELSLQLAEMAKREGLEITPFVDSELPHYKILSEENQQQVIDQLETLVFICHELHRQGEKIRSVKSLTWAFLKHFQCAGPSDLLSHMQDNDFVDAYGTNHKMLFAGLSFFEVFSYSLEEFYCRSWFDLFEREDASVNQKLLSLCEAMAAGEHGKVVSTKNMIPVHICRERISPKRILVEVEPQFFAPLYSKGEIIGYLCANRGSVIDLTKDTQYQH